MQPPQSFGTLGSRVPKDTGRPARPYSLAVIPALAVVAAGYAIGLFPTAALVGRRAGFDPTAGGSGNPGATNSLRLGGRRAGATVLAGDLAKGALAAGLGLAVGGRALGLAAGLAAVVGHVFPATRGGRGGKGVATAAGVIVVLEPVAAAVALAVFLVTVAATRTASVASLAAVAAAFVVVVALGRPWPQLVAFAALGVLILVRHRANLARLRRGNEPAVGGGAS